MDRRQFVAAGVGSVIGVTRSDHPGSDSRVSQAPQVRASFPRAVRQRFVNAAGGTPLGEFAEAGMRRYMDFQRLGPGEGRGDYVAEMQADIRPMFAELIGARPTEIALVHCTKAGEQIVLDGLDPIRRNRSIVTNDLHFSGSLHNLIGLRNAGADVRIVRAKDWDVSVDDMAAAIDDRTALVAVTLVSNINGRIEPLRELADLAHAHGAYVYADVIQATGIVPFDVRDLGIDFAATNGYKWLYGVHGAGFLYVREELQGTVLPDRLFPGHVGFNYTPWVDRADPAADEFVYIPPSDANRYQPGHVSYVGYCAVYEGLKFIQRFGVGTLFEHTVRLNRQLSNQIDTERYECITPDVNRSPIITFTTSDTAGLERRLRAANVVVTLAGTRLRVSPAIYNDESDIDDLTTVLNGA